MKDKPWLKSSIWPEGVPKSIKYPEIRTDEFLKNTAENCPDRLAIIFQGEEITYSELDELTDRFATGLDELGVEKGDVVAIMMPNCPQFPISYYGSLRIGAIVTPVSPLHSEREVEYQLKDAGAETIVTLDLELTYPKIRKIAPKIGAKRVITSEMSEYLPVDRETLSKLIDLAEVEEDDWSETEVELHRFKNIIK